MERGLYIGEREEGRRFNRLFPSAADAGVEREINVLSLLVVLGAACGTRAAVELLVMMLFVRAVFVFVIVW